LDITLVVLDSSFKMFSSSVSCKSFTMFSSAVSCATKNNGFVIMVTIGFSGQD
jgi:hypothetical protein